MRPIIKMLDFTEMLYPKNALRFEQTISKDTMEWLKREADFLLTDERDAPLALREHWKLIVRGIPPFGYTVRESE